MSTSVLAPTDSPARLAGRREWLALVPLTLAVTLLAVDGTVLALAVPSLSADLNASATDLLWICDVYSFALAGLLISMGTLADRIGRRRLLLIGGTGFGLASLLAAFAPGPGWLIAARAVLGVAGATLMPATLSIVRNLFPDDRQRTRAVAIWSTGGAGGAALGPLVGGVLLEHFWWGSVFVINLPIMAMMVLTVFWLVPESRDPHPGRFDLLSAVLSVVAIVPLVWAVKHTAHDGPDGLALAVALTGVGFGVVFARRQRVLPDPLVDLTLFRRPAFAGTVLASFIAIFAFSGLLYFFSQYLQLVHGYSPFRAGLREMPLTVASIVVAVVAVPLIARIGVGRTLGSSLLLSALGFVVLAVFETAQGYAGLLVGLIVIGLGVGLVFTAATDAVLGSVPRERAGSASAISEMSYELGVAVGIAVLGSLQGVLYRDRLPGFPGPARDSLAEATQVLGPGELLEAAQHAFAEAMRATSWIAAALLVVAGVVAWRVVPSERR